MIAQNLLLLPILPQLDRKMLPDLVMIYALAVVISLGLCAILQDLIKHYFVCNKKVVYLRCKTL